MSALEERTKPVQYVCVHNERVRNERMQWAGAGLGCVQWPRAMSGELCHTSPASRFPPHPLTPVCYAAVSWLRLHHFLNTREWNPPACRWTDPHGSRALYERSRAADKTLVPVDHMWVRGGDEGCGGWRGGVVLRRGVEAWWRRGGGVAEGCGGVVEGWQYLISAAPWHMDESTTHMRDASP